MAKIKYKLLLGISLIGAAFAASAQDGAVNERDPDGTWRFHMVQNGRVMTADDFSAWMSQRGLSLTNGKATHRPGRATSTQMVQQHSRVQPTQPAQYMATSGGSETLSLGSPNLAQTTQWQPAAQPIATAPERRAQLDGSGNLTGYDSGWSGGSNHSTTYYTSGGSTNSGSTSTSSQRSGSLVSYDSGRDF